MQTVSGWSELAFCCSGLCSNVRQYSQNVTLRLHRLLAFAYHRWQLACGWRSASLISPFSCARLPSAAVGGFAGSNANRKQPRMMQAMRPTCGLLSLKRIRASLQCGSCHPVLGSGEHKTRELRGKSCLRVSGATAESF